MTPRTFELRRETAALTSKTRRIAWRAAILSAATLPLLSAGAQLYWDTNGNTSGAGGTTPAGTWDGSTANWNLGLDGTGASTSWIPGTSAVFSAGADATGAFTITLSGTQSASGLTVEEGSVTFTGSELDLTGAAAVSIGTALTTTANNTIGGGLGFTKSGAGTLVLAANNSISGPVTINAGTVAVTSANGLANVTSITINNGGTLALSGTGALSSNVNLNLSNGSNNFYGATVVLAGTTQTVNSLSMTGGQVDLNNGTLVVTSAITSTAVPPGITLASTIGTGNGTLDIGSGSVFFQVGSGANTTIDTTINADLHGDGSLTRQGEINGTGVLTLQKSNAGFTGTFTNNGGRLLLNGANSALSAVGTINLSGGTLDINNATTNNANRINDSAAINAGGSGAITLVPNGAATTETLGAVNFVAGNTTISIGTMSLGDASLTLSSINRQAGSTIIYTTDQVASSTLGVQTSGVTPKIAINGQAAGYIGGGYLITTNDGMDLAVYDPTIGSVRAPNSTEYSTTFTDNTYVRFAPGGTTQSFTGAHTYNALTIVGTGSMGMGASTFNTGMVVKNSGANTATLGASTNTWKSNNNNEMIFGVNAGSLAVSARLNNSGEIVTKTGAGTLYFYNTDPLIPNNGTLFINQGTVLFSASVAVTSVGTIQINRGAFVQTAGATGGEKVNDGVWITLNGAAAAQSILSLGVNTGQIEHIGTLQMQGGGQLTGSNGGTVAFNQFVIRDGSVGAGSAQISNANVDLNGSMVTFDTGHNPAATVDMIVTGIMRNGGVLKQGPGTLQLSGASSNFTGGVVINNGVLIISGASTTYSGGITMNSGGTLRVGADGNLGSTSQNISFNGGTLSPSANFTLNAARPVNFDQNANIDVTSTSVNLTAANSFTGNNALLKYGIGSLTLTGSSGFSGGVQLIGGRINFNNNDCAGPADITAAPAGAASVVFGSNSGGGAILLPNNVSLQPGSGTIDFGVTSGNSLTLNGIVSGTSGLTKGLSGGTGTLTLANTGNSFSGPIWINAGTIAFADQAALGATSNSILFGGLPGQTVNSDLIATATLSLDPARAIIVNSAGAASCGLGASSNQTLTYNGTVTGPGTLSKVGGGTLILGGSNAQVGGTAVIGGNLSISTDGNLGAPGSSLSFNGGALVNSVDLVLNASRPVVFNGVGTFNTPTGTTLTVNNNATGSSGPTKTGAGTLILGGSNTFGGFVSVNGGVVRVSNDNNLGAAASVSFNGGTMLTTAGITSTKALNVAGSGVGTIDMGGFSSTFGGGITSNSTSGTLHKLGTGVLSVGFARVGSLSIDGGTILISGSRDSANKSSKVGNLTLAGGTALDLNANDLVLDYSNGGSPDSAKLTAIQGMVSAGYAGGAWTGAGITSTTAKAVAADGSNIHKTALGFAEASAAGYTSGTYDGFTVDGDMILVRYTYSGDANLDGSVGMTDFNFLAQNFNNPGTWVSGDFNFDGVTNALDFNAIATNFGQAAIPSAPGLSAPMGSLGSLVPEPCSVGLLMAGAYWLPRTSTQIIDDLHPGVTRLDFPTRGDLLVPMEFGQYV